MSEQACDVGLDAAPAFLETLLEFPRLRARDDHRDRVRLIAATQLGNAERPARAAPGTLGPAEIPGRCPQVEPVEEPLLQIIPPFHTGLLGLAVPLPPAAGKEGAREKRAPHGDELRPIEWCGIEELETEIADVLGAPDGEIPRPIRSLGERSVGIDAARNEVSPGFRISRRLQIRDVNMDIARLDSLQAYARAAGRGSRPLAGAYCRTGGFEESPVRPARTPEMSMSP